MSLKVVKSLCPQNHKCPAVSVCPVTALIQQGYMAPAVEQEKCIECGMCVNRCPMGALVLN